MKLRFFGADQCVTGSCHCLEVGGKRILVDCGLQQGRDEISNGEFPFAAKDIDAVLVCSPTPTHADISIAAMKADGTEDKLKIKWMGSAD